MRCATRLRALGPVISYHARWVVPVATPPIPDGTVVVDGSRIAYVGPRHSAPPGEDRDLGQTLLLPGLVNVHTHLELTAMRGFLEELEFHEWLTTLTRSRREVLDGEMLLDAARLGVSEGLRSGITTYADTTESGVTHRAMRELGVRGVVYQEVFGPDPARHAGALRDLRFRLEQLRAEDTELVRTGVSPHAPYSVSQQLFAGCAELARTESLPMAIHLAESRSEELYVTSGSGPFAEMQRGRGFTPSPRGRSPVAAVHEAGALDVSPLLIHCIRVDDSDMSLIAESGSSVAHCPASNAKLGHGVAPVYELLERGIVVGLGSDSVASNNRMDILEEARLASLFQRARLCRTDVLPAAVVLEMATLGGARALGLDGVIGSLEPGKQADLAAFDLGCMRAVPATDPVAAAVFALCGQDAVFVAVAGCPLVDRGRLLKEDPALPGRVQHAAGALASWRTGVAVASGAGGAVVRNSG